MDCVYNLTVPQGQEITWLEEWKEVQSIVKNENIWGAPPASGIRIGRGLYLSPFQRDSLTSYYLGLCHPCAGPYTPPTIRRGLGVTLIAGDGLLSQPLSPVGSLLNVGCLFVGP